MSTGTLVHGTLTADDLDILTHLGELASGATTAIGDDGLTAGERAEYASAYQHAVRPLTVGERAAIAHWRASRSAVTSS